MESYKKVRAAESEKVPDNELRISRRTLVQEYVKLATEQLLDAKAPTVLLSSMGQAIAKATVISEILRHRIKGVHVVNNIETVKITDKYESKVEGEEPITKDRMVVAFRTTLSLTAPKDTTISGYQAPLPDSEISADGGPDNITER